MGTLLDEPEVDRGISNDSFSGNFTTAFLLASSHVQVNFSIMVLSVGVGVSSSGDKTTNFSNGTTTQMPAILVTEQATLSTVVEAAVTWQVPVSLDNRNEMSNSTETPVNYSEGTSTDVVTTSTEIVTTSQKSIPAPSVSPESNTTSYEAGGGYAERTTQKLNEQAESDNHVDENGQNEAISLNPAAFQWNFLLLSFILFHH